MFIQCTWNRVSPSFLEGKGFLDARKTKSSPTIPPPTPLTSICGTIIPLLSCTFVKTSENPSRPSIPFQGLVVGTTDREERFRIPSQKKSEIFLYVDLSSWQLKNVNNTCSRFAPLSLVSPRPCLPQLFVRSVFSICRHKPNPR